MAKKNSDSNGAAEEPQNILVTQNVPPALVRVKEGTSFCHEGQDYTSGQEVEIDGPVAQQFVLMGFVEYVE